MRKDAMRRAGTILCFLLSIGLILIGIFDQQFQAVMAKAAKVCLECIGIG